MPRTREQYVQSVREKCSGRGDSERDIGLPVFQAPRSLKSMDVGGHD